MGKSEILKEEYGVIFFKEPIEMDLNDWRLKYPNCACICKYRPNSTKFDVYCYAKTCKDNVRIYDLWRNTYLEHDIYGAASKSTQIINEPRIIKVKDGIAYYEYPYVCTHSIWSITHHNNDCLYAKSDEMRISVPCFVLNSVTTQEVVDDLELRYPEYRWYQDRSERFFEIW